MPNLRGASPVGRDEGGRRTWHGRRAGAVVVSSTTSKVNAETRRGKVDRVLTNLGDGTRAGTQEAQRSGGSLFRTHNTGERGCLARVSEVRGYGEE